MADAVRHFDQSARLSVVDLEQANVALPDGRTANQRDDDTPALVRQIEDAEVLLFATAASRGSYTGALKNFLDVLPQQAVQSKVAGIVVVGAESQLHLGADRHLREVFAWFGGLVAPTSVFVPQTALFEEPTGGVQAEIDSLLCTLDALSVATRRAIGPFGPAPLSVRIR